MAVTFFQRLFSSKPYVSDETAPIPTSKDPVCQAANAVCIQEWFNSFVHSMNFSKTCHWLKVMFISPPLHLSPCSWSSHNSSMLKMSCVASTLSTDENEMKSTSLLYSLSSPHPRHHASEVWRITYKLHIPQKLYVLQMSVTCPQTTKCSYLAHQWRCPVPLKL